MNEETFEDAFNLLCGRKIGGGAYRNVYECRIVPEHVVKVEIEQYERSFHNVFECAFWENFGAVKSVAKWLAPIVYKSPDQRLIMQPRVTPLNNNQLPKKLPKFLTDTKPENFGILDGQIVCVDYAYQIVHAKTKLRKVNWND